MLLKPNIDLVTQHAIRTEKKSSLCPLYAWRVPLSLGRGVRGEVPIDTPIAQANQVPY
jgi:hypothetical protein